MDLRAVEMFVALAETLHYGRAARVLGVSQPTLSRGIQRLEEELQVELFDRTRRSVRLTKAGETFRSGANDLIDRSDALRRAAQDSTRPSSEHCTLGVCISGGQAQTGRLVAEFRRRHPDVSVRLRAVPDARLAAELAEGTIHAVISGDFALPHGCESRPLYTLELSAVLPKTWPIAEKAQITVDDLADVDLILPCRREQPFIWDKFQALCSQARVRPRIGIDADSMDQVFGLISGGAGMSLLPMTPGLQVPGVVMRPFRPTYPVQYCFGWRGQNAFIDRWLACIDAPPSRAHIPERR